ncbi:MAG: DNA-binding protein, partial [Thermoplasmata archaeon]|nr:DNA-binding protein [Thermoplasmata archaeon]
KEPFTINVEKLHIQAVAPHMVKKSNPMCGSCSKSMKSIGRGKGYRCSKCGAKSTEKDALFEDEKRILKTGWYEPTTSALRHLAKPLKRMIIGADK